MTWSMLVMRSLCYHWRSLALISLGVATAGAVVTGALVIGKSVPSSIRDAATERLGRIDHALTAPGLLRERLADEIGADPDVRSKCRSVAPILLDRGLARNADTDVAVPNVTVCGVDERFRDLYAPGALAVPSSREASVNESLARDLGVRIGDALLLSIVRGPDADPNSLFARRKPRELADSVRVTVGSIVSDAGVGGFALDASTMPRRNVFVSRRWLATATRREGAVNVLVAEARGADRETGRGALNRAVIASAAVEDLGCAVVRDDHAGCLSFKSRAVTLTDGQVRAAMAAARDCGLRAAPSSTYLATSIRLRGGSRSIAYAVVAGVDTGERLRALDGHPTPRQGEVVLNRWTADSLGARPGSQVDLDYLAARPDGTYMTRSAPFTVRGIVAMEGAGADPALAPDVAGVTDAENMGDWEPPFPVDLTRVTKADEAYWDRYRAAPKAFVALDTAHRFWRAGSSSDPDWVTSIRVRARTATALEADERAFTAALRARLLPVEAGLAFQPVRRLAVEAARGTNDFAGLFLGLGLFLVVSALALVSSFLRLNVERRASERGVLLACGFSVRDVQRVGLAEATAAVLLGALGGGVLGVAYGGGVLQLLGTAWSGAVASTPVSLYIDLPTVGFGVLAGAVAGVVTTLVSARPRRGERIVALLRGDSAGSTARRLRHGNRAPVMLLFGAAVLAALLPAIARGASPVAFFFAAGALALAASLSALSNVLAAGAASRTDLSVARLVTRNLAAQRRHALLVAGLVAAAVFVLLTAALNQRDARLLARASRASGDGGFALVAISSLPIGIDFGTPSGRREIGFGPQDEDAFRGVRVLRFLRSPGEDVSCRNLAKPQSPRLLGVPPEMVARGGFRLQMLRGTQGAGWRALDAPPEGRVIAAFGDSESVQWVLHSSLGARYTTLRADGTPMTLRFVGLVSRSIFAGDLLVSEAAFRGLYPHVRQPRYFLIGTPPGRERVVAEALRRNLGESGLEVRETREVLGALASVQNAYLSAFTALGGLGLVLGTVGLAVALLRAAVERRRELATMRALGFTSWRLARLLALEHATPLAAGALIGAVCALLANAPGLLATGGPSSWRAVIALPAAIAAFGGAVCLWAGHVATRGSLLEALRHE